MESTKSALHGESGVTKKTTLGRHKLVCLAERRLKRLFPYKPQ